jgi:hypothetical protein
MDLIDIYWVFHPAVAQHTFFSAAYEIFSKTDHILGLKASINKHKKIEMTLCIWSEHNKVN